MVFFTVSGALLLPRSEKFNILKEKRAIESERVTVNIKKKH